MNDNVHRENRLLRRQLKAFMEHARDNEEKMRRFQAIELRIISAATLPELIDIILYDYPDTFSLDAVSLMLIDNQQSIRQFLHEENYELDEHPDLLFASSHDDLRALESLSLFPTLGAYKPRRHCNLFPNARPKPASVAILPLVRHGKVIGCMSLGSEESERFINGSATDFLERVAAVAAIALENTLNHERLKRTGLTDPLTMINNRRFFDQRLREEVSRAHRNQQPLSCLFLDVDHFKHINDNYGHQVGDYILAEVAALLTQQMRTTDVLARYGGEEFAFLLSNTGSCEAFEIAERIRQRIATQDFALEEQGMVSVTVSIGVATLIPEGDQSGFKAYGEWLVGYADRALLEAKESGRNQVINAGIIHADTEQQRQGVVMPSLRVESPN